MNNTNYEVYGDVFEDGGVQAAILYARKLLAGKLLNQSEDN